MFIILLASFSSVPASADYTQCNGCHLYGGKFEGYSSAPSSLGYWSDLSITQYGYSDSVTEAVSQWGPQAYIPSFNSSSESNAQIKYYIGTLDPLVGGQVFFYNSVDLDISNSVEGTDIGYKHAIVVIHHDYLKTLSGFGPSLRHTIVTHETGHTLGVSHLTNSPAHTGSNVMNAGASTYTLTTTDIQHAQYKFLNDY
jgi:hypothetical protein